MRIFLNSQDPFVVSAMIKALNETGKFDIYEKTLKYGFDLKYPNLYVESLYNEKAHVSQTCDIVSDLEKMAIRSPKMYKLLNPDDFFKAAIDMVARPIEVKLNNQYTAKITKDTVEVGCQKFPISVIKEVLRTWENNFSK